MLKSIMILAFTIMALAMPIHAQEIIEGEPTGQKSQKEEDGKFTIVLFYADWCPSCKILLPRLNDAISDLENKDIIRIVKFDFSNDLTQVESAGLAGEHGLSDIYNEYSPGTGFAILVDQDIEIYEQKRLTVNDSTIQITEKIKKFIKTKT